MQTLAAFILGIIQGLTEFLPISSSAHLILVPWFFGWEPEGLVFDVALHVGTAIAVIAFFWKDWMLLARETLVGLKERAPLGNSHRRLFWLLVVGTLPALVVGLALEDIVESHLRSPLITVGTLIVFGLLLHYAEKRGRQNRSMESFAWGDAIAIGLSQAVALIPGVSRSGITMTAALWRHSNKTCAARFSFLLSTPVILGAGLLAAWKLFEAARHPLAGATAIPWGTLGVGTATAAVTGFLCIKFFLRYLQSRSFFPFVIYRIALAMVVLLYFLRAR